MALNPVDLVVIFDSDTPLSLIESINPSVLMKGSDYSVDTVVGSEFVMSNGGSVKLLKTIQDRSTTSVASKFSQ